MSEINHQGNVVIQTTKERSLALIGEAVVELTQYALARGKSLVVEQLDFKKNNQELAESSPQAARALSSLLIGHVKFAR